MNRIWKSRCRIGTPQWKASFKFYFVKEIIPSEIHNRSAPFQDCLGSGNVSWNHKWQQGRMVDDIPFTNWFLVVVDCQRCSWNEYNLKVESLAYHIANERSWEPCSSISGMRQSTWLRATWNGSNYELSPLNGNKHAVQILVDNLSRLSIRANFEDGHRYLGRIIILSNISWQLNETQRRSFEVTRA